MYAYMYAYIYLSAYIYLLDCIKCSEEKRRLFSFFLPLLGGPIKGRLWNGLFPWANKGSQQQKRRFSPLQYHIWREFISKIMNPYGFLTSVCFKDQSRITVECLCTMVTLRKTYEISLIYFGTFFVSLRLFQNKSLKIRNNHIKCVTHVE